ncbi:hypothetical protein Salat_1725600 [Sesamum alatum]|uniref:Uncharacterized protein n=1 Tax=Sesamum alatum TaxID=300844 RepID=A0AAE2CKB3_9LAMI|nr:hypothetical protein Salat_1725600 [Sesamum alatum]
MSSVARSVSSEYSSNSSLHSSSHTFFGSSATFPTAVPSNLDKVIKQARIANRLHAKKGTLPPNVAPLTDSSNQGASSAPKGRSSGNLGDSSTPIEPTLAISPVPSPVPVATAIEIPSRETEAASPIEPKKRNRKHKGSRTSKSSKWSKSRSDKKKAKQAADKDEEAENLKLVAELTEWRKGARTELQTPKCVFAEMEGEKLVPDWVISTQSSVLKTHVGQDSWELYKGCLLPRDQATFVPIAHT